MLQWNAKLVAVGVALAALAAVLGMCDPLNFTW